MKKLLSLLLALTMLCALPLPVHAAGFLPEETDSTDVLLLLDSLEAPAVWFEEDGEYDLAAARQAAIDAHKTGLGGVPGEMGVMLNGAYLQFPDAAPIAENNVLLAPQDVLLPALGLKALPAALHSAGPFFRNGAWYVALRPVAESLGYDVLWDAQFDSAVLIHRTAIIDGWNARATIVSGMMERLRNLTGDGSLRSTLELSATITVFDTIDGDKSYKLGLDAKAVSSATATETEGTFRLSDAQRLLEPYLAPFLSSDDPTTAALFETALGLLRELKFSLRCDLESGRFYLNIPALSVLLPALGEDDWILIDLPLFEDISAMQTLTVGDLLYAISENTLADPLARYAYDMDRTTPVFSYVGITERGNQMLALLEDAAFVRDSNRNVLRLSLDEVAPLVQLFFGGDVPLTPTLKECSVTLSVRDDHTFDLAFHVRPQTLYNGRTLSDLLVTGNWKEHDTGTILTLNVHVKNSFRFSLSLNKLHLPATLPPKTVPPEDATVLELWELAAPPLSENS